MSRFTDLEVRKHLLQTAKELLPYDINLYCCNCYDSRGNMQEFPEYKFHEGVDCYECIENNLTDNILRKLDVKIKEEIKRADHSESYSD